MNKYAAVRRSHLMIALHVLACELEHVKPGCKRHGYARRQRTELLDELQKRDAELIVKFEKAVSANLLRMRELARVRQESRYDKLQNIDRAGDPVVAVPDVLHVAKRARVFRSVKHVHKRISRKPIRKRHVRDLSQTRKRNR